MRATDAQHLSKQWAAGKAPAGHRPRSVWLRLRPAALYRRVALCEAWETPTRGNAPTLRRLQVGDTADWKSALQQSARSAL